MPSLASAVSDGWNSISGAPWKSNQPKSSCSTISTCGRVSVLGLDAATTTDRPSTHNIATSVPGPVLQRGAQWLAQLPAS